MIYSKFCKKPLRPNTNIDSEYPYIYVNYRQCLISDCGLPQGDQVNILLAKHAANEYEGWENFCYMVQTVS